MSTRARITALVVALSLVLALAGCTWPRRADTDGTQVSFYYEYRDAEQLRDIEEIVAPELRSVSVLSLWDFLDAYFAGPESDELMSPFPAGTRVQGVQYTDSILTLTLSGEFFTLMGVELSVASYCLAETVCAYTERDSMILMDETESIHIEISPKQFSLSNHIEGDINESFTVYFSDANHRYLIAEVRDATLSQNETEAAYVLRRLLEGPENTQLETVVPAGTELLGLSVMDGVCTVNFSEEFYENRPEDDNQNYLTIYGVVDTLTSLNDVESVQFLVDGNVLERYGMMQLGQPLTRNADCIGPVRTASGEVDVNIYVRSTLDQTTFAMPRPVKQTISEPLAEAVLLEALTYEPPEGFYNPIPYGTELQGVSVSGSVCYVDVSEKFIPQEDTEAYERAAVRALVMLLTDLDGITSVVLTIDGESGGLSHVNISEPLRRETVALW